MTLRAVKQVTSGGDGQHVAPSNRPRRASARTLVTRTPPHTDLLADAVLLQIERASRILKARAVIAVLSIAPSSSLDPLRKRPENADRGRDRGNPALTSKNFEATRQWAVKIIEYRHRRLGS